MGTKHITPAELTSVRKQLTNGAKLQDIAKAMKRSTEGLRKALHRSAIEVSVRRKRYQNGHSGRVLIELYGKQIKAIDVSPEDAIAVIALLEKPGGIRRK